MKPDYKHLSYKQATPDDTPSKFKKLAIPLLIVTALACTLLALSLWFSKKKQIQKDYLPLPTRDGVVIEESFGEAWRMHFELDLPPNKYLEQELANKTPDTPMWSVMKVSPGDTFGQLAEKHGINHSDVLKLANDEEYGKSIIHLRPGQEIKYRINGKGELLNLLIKLNESAEIQAQKSDQGAFTFHQVNHEFDVRENRATGTITSSFYGAALKANMSDNIIMQLAEIFGYDIDFSQDIRSGDHFNVIWSEYYKNGVKVKDGEILAAEFFVNGRKVSAIRYTTEEDETGYFTPQGKTLKKAFMRNPIHFTRISSKFNLFRVHPKFKTVRPHKGVDYAAPKGTPIYASGDGKIYFRGQQRGYGNVIYVQHTIKKFMTVYAHMSKFNKKFKKGSRVKQGETIGYVGQTGWATGPHLHYEFRVHGVHKNPLTVKLPTAVPLKKKYLADFKEKSRPLLQQLRLLDQHQRNNG